MCNTQKMVIQTPGNAGRTLFCYQRVAVSLFVTKDQARLVIELIGV